MSRPETRGGGFTKKLKNGKQETSPISIGQKRLFTLHQLVDDYGQFNMPVVISLHGDLDIDRLEAALNRLLHRHESLRTTFLVKEREPVQRVLEHHEFKLDFEVIKAEELEEEVESFIQPFDLLTMPVFRVKLIKVSGEKELLSTEEFAECRRDYLGQYSSGEHYLLIDVPQIVGDATSLEICLEELFNLYSGKELPLLSVQYRDYLTWQRGAIVGNEFNEQEEYWMQRLAGELPVLELQTDYRWPKMFTRQSEYYRINLELELSVQLRELANRFNTTIETLLLASFYVLLARYTGQEDMIIGKPVACRGKSEFQGVVGYFENTLALRSNPRYEMKFSEFLQEVHNEVVLAYHNADYPLELLTQRLNPVKVLNRHPLFDAIFLSRNVKRKVQLENLAISVEDIFEPHVNFYFALMVDVNHEILSYTYYYSPELYKVQTVQGLAHHHHQLLQQIVMHSELTIGEMPLVSDMEKDKLLRHFNNTAVDFPRDRTVQELFASQVQRHPDLPAVVMEDQMLTYAELHEKSSQLADRLRKMGVGQEVVVGIIADRSIEMIIGVLGIVQAGGAYLPIDLAYPVQRIAFMLEDSGAQLLLSPQQVLLQAELVACIHIPRISIIESNGHEIGLAKPDLVSEIKEGVMADLSDEAGRLSRENLYSPRDLIYIIYTSGSTGEPKGVMIEHRNVIRLVINSNMLKIDEGTRILQTGSLAFDASTFEIWGTLLNGGTLCLIKQDDLLTATRLRERIGEYKIEMLWLTAPFFNQLLEDELGFLRGVQTLIVGGDVLSPKHIQVARKLYPDMKILNGYGPTEGTTFTTFYDIHEKRLDLEHSIPIGKPVSNTEVFILNKVNSLQPIGVPGELCIGGAGLARGYLNRPELTADRFLSNPYRPGEKMYRSGDLALWLDDGQIEFLGRIDQQVKVRGYRIELGEIETELLKDSRITEVLVIVNDDLAHRKSVYAYYVATEPITAGDLRNQLAKTLPEYMLPSYFIQLERFPLNPNGKIDKGKLPQPEDLTDSGQIYCSPQNSIEQRLVELWSEVLKVQQIGTKDNFFDLGGHSLRAVKLLTQIHREFGIQLSPQTLFLHPTIQELAEIIQNSEIKAYANIKPAPEADDYQLSSGQKRLWILNQLGVEQTAYNITSGYDFTGDVVHDALRQTLETLIQRHESLRTIFLRIQGEPRQKILSTVELQIQEVDLREFSVECIEYQEVLSQEMQTPFDLEKGPLFRINLIHLAGKVQLLFTLHHIIADGWSMDIFKREFEILYNAYCQNQLNPLPPLRIQYKDFTYWQTQLLQSEQFAAHRNYWHKQLAGNLQALKLPVDYPYGDVVYNRGGVYRFTVSGDVQRELQKIARAEGVSMFMILLTAFMAFLQKVTGDDDILVGIPVAGREHADLKELIGFFLNTLIIRNQFSSQDTFLHHLYQIKEVVLNALTYQAYPFEQLNEELKIVSDLNQPSLLSVVFNMLNFESNTEGELLKEENQHLVFEQGAKYDLGCLVTEYLNGISVDCQYRTELFRKETIEYLMTEYQKLLVQISKSPDLLLADYQILTPEVMVGNRVCVDHPFEEFPCSELETSLVQRFEKQVMQYGDRVALSYGGQKLTYAELNSKANRLSGEILKIYGAKLDVHSSYTTSSVVEMAAGIEDSCDRFCVECSPEYSQEYSQGYPPRVGLLFGHGIEMIVGIFGTIKSSMIYVPLDLSHPEDRLLYIIKDAGICLLLTNAENLQYAQKLIQQTQQEIQVVNLDELWNNHVNTTTTMNIKPSQPAYILYTSGSTGRPKGVVQSHRNVLHFIRNYTNNLHISRNDRLTLLSSFGFDAALMDIYGALLNGATLCPYDIKAEASFARMIEWLNEEKITIYHSIPSVFRYMTGALTDQVFPTLRLLVMGGEEVFKKDLETYRHHFSEEVIFINGLGPTESTVTLQFLIDQNLEITRLSVPVGYPVEETEVFLLDKEGKEVQVYGVGEIIYKSSYLALGYWNDPAGTAKAFTLDPRNHQGRVYRSGDLGRLLPDGSIEFVGRKDQQVKIRGYRIEINEVETVLNHLPEISQGVVTFCADASGENRLVCYYTPKNNLEIDDDEIRRALRDKLPGYMIPAYFRKISEFPLTATGKIDRANLPHISLMYTVKSSYLGPKNEIENQLVALWAEVLGIEAKVISVNQSFFDLGGDSLKLIHLADLIKGRMEYPLKVTDLLTYSTIQELAGLIKPVEHTPKEQKIVKFTY